MRNYDEAQQIIEAMARAACRHSGNANPDGRGSRLVMGVRHYNNPAWHLWLDDAAALFYMHREMAERLAEIGAAKGKKEGYSALAERGANTQPPEDEKGA